jgi:hypothetical protein
MEKDEKKMRNRWKKMRGDNKDKEVPGRLLLRCQAVWRLNLERFQCQAPKILSNSGA